MRRLFPSRLNILSSQCTGLNLATVMMHQPTVDSSKTGVSELECDKFALQEKDLVTQGRDLEQKRNIETHFGNEKWEMRIRFYLSKDQHTFREGLYIQKSNFFPLLFLLFSSSWPFSSFMSPPNGNVIFLFLAVSTPQLCSQRQVLLSHYLIIGAMQDHSFGPWHSEKPVTFMGVQLCWFTERFQLRMQGKRHVKWRRTA